MPHLTVIDRSGSEAVLEGEVGLSVMEIIRDSGFGDVAALCGGVAACATCHVYIESDHAHALPPVGEDEDAMLDSAAQRKANSRLACQIPFTRDLSGLKVTIAPED